MTMETRQLNGPIFMLGALVVATIFYVYHGEATQKILSNLTFLLLAIIFTCCFIIGASITLIRQKIKRVYLRYPAEINFSRMRGLAALPPKYLKKNCSKIKTLITEDPTEEPLGRTQQASLNNALEKFKELLPTDF